MLFPKRKNITKEAIPANKNMDFFNSAVDVLQTLVIALGAGLCICGGINLLGGYGNYKTGAMLMYGKEVDKKDRQKASLFRKYREPD